MVLGFIGMMFVVLLAWVAILKLIPPIAGALPNPQQTAFQKFAPLAYLVAPLVVFLVWVMRHRRKKKRYSVNRAVWENSWLCTKCGAVWMP